MKTLGNQTCSANILMGGRFEVTISCLDSNTYATAEFFWRYSILKFTIISRNRSKIITVVNICNNLLHGKNIS